MNVQAAAGCTARAQARATPSPALDARDYIECFDASASPPAFFALGPSGSFNDQVLKVTTADILPVLEAAISKRIEREIAPQLQNLYSGVTATCPASCAVWGLPAGARLYPFAAPFASPGPGAGTSSYAGAAGTYQGLLPFNQVNCTADANNPRCLPGIALVSWFAATAYDGGGVGYIQTQSCWWETGASARVCEGEYREDGGNPGGAGMRIEMQMTLNNVAMGLRTLDTTRMQVSARDDGSMTWIAQAVTQAVTMNSDGSVTIRFGANLPNIDSMGWGSWAEYRIRIERLVMNDHPLLDSTSTGAGATGWFVRNDWFRLLYYATAQNHTAATLPGTPSCTSGTNCLRLTAWPSTVPETNKRALLILAGRALAGQARPSTAPANYVEFGNNDGGTLYEQRQVSRATFNDRVVVVDANP